LFFHFSLTFSFTLNTCDVITFIFKAIRRERTFAGNGSANSSLGGHVIAGSVDSTAQVILQFLSEKR
jgi:hypothetical protein